MAFSYDHLRSWKIPETRHEITPRDVMLYGLGIGLGADPLDRRELRYVYEDKLQAFPTMAVVMGYPGFWMQDPGTGIDWVKVVHGEQGMELHKPLPVKGTVIGKSSITDIVDKGEGKGAIVLTRRDIYDEASGDLICTVRQSTFCRGDGGCGGPGGTPPKPQDPPARAPDRVVEIPTLPQAALIYRLSGDYNPLHADPDVATRAGFPRPILHGLCTYATAARALLQGAPDDARLTEYFARFSAIVYPGDRLSVRIWDTAPGEAAFQAFVGERMVLAGGRARIRSATAN